MSKSEIQKLRAKAFQNRKKNIKANYQIRIMKYQNINKKLQLQKASQNSKIQKQNKTKVNQNLRIIKLWKSQDKKQENSKMRQIKKPKELLNLVNFQKIIRNLNQQVLKKMKCQMHFKTILILKLSRYSKTRLINNIKKASNSKKFQQVQINKNKMLFLNSKLDRQKVKIKIQITRQKLSNSKKNRYNFRKVQRKYKQNRQNFLILLILKQVIKIVIMRSKLLKKQNQMKRFCLKARKKQIIYHRYQKRLMKIQIAKVLIQLVQQQNKIKFQKQQTNKLATNKQAQSKRKYFLNLCMANNKQQNRLWNHNCKLSNLIYQKNKKKFCKKCLNNFQMKCKKLYRKVKQIQFFIQTH
ncbi:hypothetical protein TTHERM_000421059 (macronuclear) [Tetrahymena thermophila SB210]|uniref:Uncharacterized protein n=1 Tax=Tetrahymena thermophila (strain SB210) TaxID=312017 RepID=W7XHN5_TETTS|nr:hypothetical protein TTHERM_000421059 [Tetrahymena thermophila SB210]EWS72659.1 hypothetical protein TTHERM_000421059 [Tetrahymena thermophila SB210]|eukprot:XP_012654827.1 hypothetical protein TTHERM_000421059 [Tetrahymena thermophila SB210]